MNMSTAPQRRQSSRPTRTATSRPTNYYARPFPSARSGPAGTSTTDDGISRAAAPGFFPALTHFTGSVTALPKEVMKHFSMLKEVEAKVYGPGEELSQLVDAFLGLTPPPSADASLGGLTANMPISDAKSLGGAINYGSSAQVGANHPVADSNSYEGSDLERRKLYQRMRYVLHDMSMLLDEKNAVLSSANQTLAKQLARMESSYNFVSTEVSDEARLGSTTHWAYTDKDAGKVMISTDRMRREGIPSSSALAMASTAAAVVANHEAKLAASRSEARREAMIAKRNRNRHVDSEFDDGLIQKKNTIKAKKQVPEAAVDARGVGLGIANAGQPTKRRRTEKAMNAAPAMERSASNNASGVNKNRAAAAMRGNPAPDNHKKRARAAPSPLMAGTKRRNGTNGAKSPRLASSPLYSESFENPPKREEKQEDKNRQGANMLHSPTRITEISKKGFLSPIKPVENDETIPPSRVPDSRDQRNQVQGHTDSKILADTTEPVRTIEDSTTKPDANNQRKPSIAEQEQLSKLPITTAPMTGAASATIPSSNTFSSFPPLPPPASAPLVSTSDLNHESDQQVTQQMTTRANRAASVSSKSGTSAQLVGPEIAPPPRARNTRNNGQRPANSSRNSSTSTFNDTIADRNNDHAAAAAAASATGSGQPRRSHKKGSGAGNGGTSSGRTSRRGSASSYHQHHNLTTAETLMLGANPRPITGHPAMPGTDGATEHGSRRGSTTGQGDEHGNGRGRSDVVNDSGNNNNLYGPTKSRRDADPTKDSGKRTAAQAVPGETGARGDGNNEEDEDGNEDDDADEPRYCYCNQVSYGEMVACDNPDCLREWFHLACVGLSRPPSSKSKWYCNECKDSLRLARPVSSRH